ncbi:hypothetical protein [Jiangella alkaliphila]|uniref:hypothetical protein n=1 Tax=Jiangella alkaliphila TaxID=419479 RepID=UPI0006295060|nr:hypothetical protein [Jiangella alkaliphila]
MKGVTFPEITAQLDTLYRQGFRVVEILAPYDGQDSLDHGVDGFTIDAASVSRDMGMTPEIERHLIVDVFIR